MEAVWAKFLPDWRETFTVLQIFDIVPADRLRKLLSQYSDVFHSTVYLLGSDKGLLLRYPDIFSQEEIIMKPVYLRDSPLGYVAVPSTDKEAETHLGFIAQNLSEMIEMGYEIESLSGEVARNYEELSLLWNLSSKLGSELDVEKICNILADQVMSICPSKNISIMLDGEIFSNTLYMMSFLHQPHITERIILNCKKSALFPKISLGINADKASKMTLKKDEGLIGYALHKKEALTIHDVYSDERFETFPYPVKSILIVPLIAEDTVIGAIICSDKLNDEEFLSKEIKLISGIASECALSLKKALLYDEIQNMLFSTAEAFAFAIEAKDPYTYGHSKRVSEMTVQISLHLGLSPDKLNRIRLAALLHDIGKIGTPEDILHKSGKLTPDEMSKIKEHSVIGSRMVEHIKRMTEIAQWIYHHHEKYDGSGYPAGIGGNAIPLASRIISIADNYDALTSDRPYRKAFTKEESIRIMRKSVGLHFDPFLFRYFEKEVHADQMSTYEVSS
jgi:putative nucleotidyltransferase with HDIG domain